jgi:hypothetical protein
MLTVEYLLSDLSIIMGPSTFNSGRYIKMATGPSFFRRCLCLGPWGKPGRSEGTLGIKAEASLAVDSGPSSPARAKCTQAQNSGPLLSGSWSI